VIKEAQICIQCEHLRHAVISLWHEDTAMLAWSMAWNVFN